MWRASVITIFPEMFPGPLGLSLAGKALAAGLWGLGTVDIRGQTADRHRSVDDTPAGGGPGMVMRADILAKAVETAAQKGDKRPRLLMSPRGLPLTQARVEVLARGPGVIIVCGRFEGVDERVIEGRQLLESRSATMCCRAARSRPACSSTPASGSYRASWARKPRRPRRASPMGCSNIRNIPGPRSGKVGRSPRS